MMEEIGIIFSMICYLITYLIIFKIFNKNKFKIKSLTVILLILLSIFMTFLSVNKLILPTILTNLFSAVILNYINYEEDIIKTIYFALIMWLSALIGDALVSVIFLIKNFKLYLEFIELFNLRTLLAIPVILMELFICLVFRKKMLKFYDKFISKISNNIHLILTILSLVYIVFWFFCINAFNVVNVSMRFISISIITLIILMVIYILYNMYKLKNISDSNKKIIEENNYIKGIAKQDEEFKHNLVNNLLGIKTMANKKVCKLIDELINDYQQEYINITNINDLPNGVQSIIYRKAYEENIEDLNLIVDNSIKKELYDILTPKKYNHLCTSIGILFDNALQAVKNNDEKVIEISFLEDDENICFIIKNSFSNYIDLEELGKRSFTTKLIGHGIGINYISKLKTIKYKKEIINNMFVSKIIIKKI